MDYKTKTNLILPFKGTWIVGNGGRSPEKNNHYDASLDQRYACDFIRPHKKAGKQLEDYEAFGGEVIAPADGLVCQVVNELTDMQIGDQDDENLVGNMVVIDHKNGEWSMLCHFKHSSIIVKEGKEVKQGDLLGLCGNTGNSSEPHIHYQLQDNPLRTKANGLPAQFARILVDGKVKENFEPELDQKVSNFK